MTIKTLAESTIPMRRYLIHEDWGSFRRALLHMLRVRFATTAWIIAILGTIAALINGFYVLARVPGEYAKAGWAVFWIVAITITAMWFLLGVIYSAYRDLKRRAMLVISIRRAFRFAFAKLGDALQRIEDRRAERDRALGRSPDPRDLRLGLWERLKEASLAGKDYPPEFLLTLAVQAVADQLRQTPTASDIWIKQKDQWWCPEFLPYVHPNLNPEKADQLRSQRYLLCPRTTDKSVSEEILRTLQPCYVDASNLAPNSRKLGFTTCLGIPLISDKGALGVFWVRYLDFQPRELLTDDIDDLMDYCRDLATSYDALKIPWARWLEELRKELVSQST